MFPCRFLDSIVSRPLELVIRPVHQGYVEALIQFSHVLPWYAFCKTRNAFKQFIPVASIPHVRVPIPDVVVFRMLYAELLCSHVGMPKGVPISKLRILVFEELVIPLYADAAELLGDDP